MEPSPKLRLTVFQRLGEHIERRPWPFVLALSLLYLEATCIRAARTKLWFDEILTIYVSGLPSASAIVSFLKEGFELNPPFGHIMVGVSGTLFGRNEVGFRVPAIVAFWIMSLCLYLFLRRRVPASFALAGMLFPSLTGAAPYAYEARPYALMLGFAAVALVSWQAAAEGRARPLSLALIACSLAGALSSSPMAVLLAIPFAAGEVVRTIQRKRVDWFLWISFLAATPALRMLLDLRAVTGTASYTQNVTGWLGPAVATYAQLLETALWPLALAVAGMIALSFPGPMPARKPAVSIPSYEVAALLGFAAIPFAAVPVSTMGGPYWVRYSLPCVIGLSGGLILLLAWGTAMRLACGALLAIVFCTFFILGQVYPLGPRVSGAFNNTSEEIRPFLESITPGSLPIVIPYSLTFLELEYYSSPQLAARLYYLTDHEAAAKYVRNISFDVKGPLLKKWFPLRARFQDYRSFVASHKQFLLAGPDWWVRSKLIDDGAAVVLRSAGGYRYYDVQVK